MNEIRQTKLENNLKKRRNDKRLEKTKKECAIFVSKNYLSVKNTLLNVVIAFTKCLLTWLEKNNTCPCCRKELYEKYVIPEEYMSDDEFVDSDDEMPELQAEGLQALAGSAEEKAPEEEDDSLHTQFELDVYQSMADTFGNIVTHPDQRDWMVDRHTLVEHLVQYTNHLIPDDPEYPVRVENVNQLCGMGRGR